MHKLEDYGQQSKKLPHRLLSEYDSDCFGPIFAISDEGSAGLAIRDAAYASAKARALAPVDSLALGVALDGERMTSAGEVPIGPPEYRDLSCAASGHLLCTTNVGVRVNTRLSQLLPEFPVDTKTVDAQWLNNIISTFTPFLLTPDSRPRPLTVRLRTAPGSLPPSLKHIVQELEARRSAGNLGPRDIHRFALLLVFEDEIHADTQIANIEAAIDAAADAGLDEVCLDATVLENARQRLAIQSLLNIIKVQPLQRLLKKARVRGVHLTYRYQLDVESAARTIWTGLHSARVQGFSAGKYGLVPLTLDEQRHVVELISSWMADWTAIPAFYVDTPLLTSREVYDTANCMDAACVWLKMVRGAGAKTVLFDCPDRINPRRLLKEGDHKDEVGVLTLKNVEDLLAYAKDLGVSILWSGGITINQAYELAKRRVFGIFSTSSTATKIAVTAPFQQDPRLPAENEPTELGVRNVHAAIQGGFLCASLAHDDQDLADSIGSHTKLLITSAPIDKGKVLNGLDEQLIKGWISLGKLPQLRSRSKNPRALNPPMPVPADAVRVFRGRRHSSLAHEGFVSKLGTVFMPMTVQMQRLYELNAYLPAIMPSTHNSILPDEIALVFYKTQHAYQEAKRCVGGRAYSELHELVFNMSSSRSSFPERFTEDIKIDTPYHLFSKSTDWQQGETYLYVGVRRQSVDRDAFKNHLCRRALEVTRSPGDLDGAIFCFSEEWVLWWEHSQSTIPERTVFSEVAEDAFVRTARQVRIPDSLVQPYSGIHLDDKGDFVNLKFTRS
jgi:hypothetical protein